MDGELKMKDSWSYRGAFKNGKIDEKGKFEWNKNNYLDSYFSDGKINGITTISWSNNIINAVFKNNKKNGASNISIKIFEAKFDGHVYKIKEINQEKIPVDGKVLIIDKDDNEYFIGIICINDNIKIEEYNMIEEEEKHKLLDCLNSIEKIVIPKFKPFSFNKNEFIPSQQIKFQNGIIYNNKTKKLTLENGEYFQGVLNYDENNNKYNLDIGEYNWPSGQKYSGKFDNKNNFEGKSKIISDKNVTFNGQFNNGNANGYGEILWENGDYVKGNFKEEKIDGHAEIKKNGISFEANYNNSIMNGAFSNIKILRNNHNYKISKISINKGIINDDFFDIEDEEGNKNQIKLSKGDKAIFHYNEDELLFLFKYLSKIRRINITFFSPTSIADEGLNINENNKKKNKKNKKDDNNNNNNNKDNNNNNNNKDKDNNINNNNNINSNNNNNTNNDKNNNIKLTFPNNEIFKGTIKKYDDDKYYLVEGEYEWPSGQKYKGSFFQNRLDSENGELIFNDWIYKGGFKNGFIEGYGSLEKNNKNEKNGEKGEKIKGYFKKGELIKDIEIENNDFYFKGNLNYNMKDIYIKSLATKFEEHNYEIKNFKMTDREIKFKKDDIYFLLN